MKLSILMPVYNERYVAARQVRRVLDAPLPEGVERQLVIVDDGSTDGTREILGELAAAHPKDITFVKHERNQGKGAAIRTAVERAQGDLCIFQDADLEYDPGDYRRLLEPILSGHADVVFGSRFLPSERRRVLYYRHELGNRFLTALSNLFTDLNLTDMETCYKLIPTDVLRFISIECRGFGIEPEVTAKVAKLNLRVYEVPVRYDGRTYAEGKKITWKDGFRALFVILKYAIADGMADRRAGSAALSALSRARRFNRWTAEMLRPFVGHRVLEIGAGTGNMTVQFLPRDRFVASDLDDVYLTALRSLALRRPGLEVARIDATRAGDFAPYEGQVDTVLCANVLEHVSDLGAALANIGRALAPGGRAVILVAQGRWLYCPLDKAIGRARRLSRRELTEALAAAGFQVERASSFNRAGLFGWLVNGKILRRVRPPALQIRLYDSFVWLWRLADRILPWPGLSLVVVARKPAPPHGSGAAT